MKIFVLGGDGFCGWPTALHLSNNSHEVIIIDNLSRRKIDVELEVQSLTPIASISDRIKTWNNLSEQKLEFIRLDIANEYDKLVHLINQEKPDCIVHFAEQRAAPYSMKSSREKRYTVENNISATNNVLSAIVESKQDIHLVHLGTMGVYGYSSANFEIPEGYLNIKVEDQNGDWHQTEILYPSNPGSIYHLTKTQDALLFAFYNKNDAVRITDLHQGIVWGTETEETRLDPMLINRFDYDGDYGTVLNRFLMQAALQFPLTVHGTGGQTRAFIHIRDTVQCIRLAIENPPQAGTKVKIFNQATETHKVRNLAQVISEVAECDIQYLPNPRKEDAENELQVNNDSFLQLGLEPILLKNGLLEEVKDIATKYLARCDKNKILSQSFWTTQKKSDAAYQIED